MDDHYHYHMYLATSSPIIIVLSLLTTLPQSNCQLSEQNETKFSVCEKPFNCGSLSKISYPFSGNNTPSYCGIFNLKCGPPSQYVSIQINSQSFEVQDINTETNTMTLVRQNQINDVCSRNLTNVSLSTALFSYTETVRSVTVFYDCSSTIGGNNFTCQNDGSLNAVYVDVDQALLHRFSELNECKSSTLIEAPSMEGVTLDPDTGTNEAYLKNALNGAFEVKYFAGGDECTRCRQRGGICGTSDVSRDQFSCFCSDTSKDCSSSLYKEKMGHHSNKKKLVVGIMVGCGILAMLMLMPGLLIYKRRDNIRKKRVKFYQDYMLGERIVDVDSQKFDFRTIANATCNFSSDNKLGEGGFGSVYKGTLMSGKDIAVKRLSLNSRQGLNELINEVNTIAKLQHRNLVQLLGCCLEKEEKMLVYEYLPNKSLDFFIFDQTRSKLLNWEKRIHIIVSTARGLLYLHQDSRMRIIHRDLKANNVLLDENMNPKISYFGLAKAFWEDQTETMTNKIVGTYGYMPPEYVMHGKVSVKSDVYSFGVLILEILSGKKNRALIDPDHQLNLLGHSWRLWVENRQLELVDDSFRNTTDANEVLRCICVGLLCVQPRPKDRPDMKSVVVMLTTDGNNLPRPNQPAFFVEKNLHHHEDLSAAVDQRPCSENIVSISLLEART